MIVGLVRMLKGNVDWGDNLEFGFFALAIVALAFESIVTESW